MLSDASRWRSSKRPCFRVRFMRSHRRKGLEERRLLLMRKYRNARSGARKRGERSKEGSPITAGGLSRFAALSDRHLYRAAPIAGMQANPDAMKAAP